MRDYSPFYIPGAIVIAGLIIGVSLIFAFGGTQAPGTGTTPTVKVNVEDVEIAGRPYIGEQDAPVTLVAWADYQCPYCKAVEVGHEQIPTPPSMPTLIKDYVNTGKLKIVFKDYAFLSEDSNTAALYGHAMWELYPTKYYEWREAMYKAQDEEHAGFGNETTILALSKKIAGVDSNALKNIVAQKKAEYTALMDADRAEGTKFGITGTPGFITGETLIPGAVGIEQFKAAIDAQL
jgi:protein-disulfide isomerase